MNYKGPIYANVGGLYIPLVMSSEDVDAIIEENKALKESQNKPSQDTIAIIAHSVELILNNCGNSYANAYTEQWLIIAKEAGAYHGRTIGKIHELKEEWELWCHENGMPDWEEKEEYYHFPKKS